MRRPAWVAELRTWLSGVDPGLSRLRLASVAVLAMATAAAVMMAVKAMVGVSVTVVLFAAVLAMISNLSVNEVEPTRQRVTTALMVLPASASVLLGTLLVPHRVAADVVFVLVMAAAVYVRSYGPRGMALGMAGFMPYFLTQFLQATVAELRWLLVAVLVGIIATLVLRTWLFAEHPARVLHGLLRAFRARLHALIREVAEILADEHGRGGVVVERRMRAVRQARARLNDTALLVADQLDRLAEDDAADCDLDGLTLRVLDAELAAERLAVATRRMLQRPELLDPSTSATLIVGVRALERATESGTSTGAAAVALADAEDAVAGLITGSATGGNRVQRVGFAVARLSEALALVDNGDAAVRPPDPPAPVSESDADEA